MALVSSLTFTGTLQYAVRQARTPYARICTPQPLTPLLPPCC